MPLDNSGAPAPSSRHAERLARLKLLRRKASAEQRKLRRFSKARLLTAEDLLKAIVAGADFIGEVTITDDTWINPFRAGAVCLLVTLDRQTFGRLCEHGAELEDVEDSPDAEPDYEGQPSLMATTGADLLGFDGTDNEMDACDLGEPKAYAEATADRAFLAAARTRYTQPPEPERRGAITYATVDPETKRAGMWVLHRKARR